ncbi:MAG: DUF6364 family protein [Acidobacteriota bacterium]|nr:DUF6364 family protein [Acidobacteriota bacterium]MDE3266364.1 DUF6364 family protein [Acidobacteriota bacterium]
MDVTLSIDERIVAEARRIASLRGTSLNQLVRDYLHDSPEPTRLKSWS